jgi:hypothetical protein
MPEPVGQAVLPTDGYCWRCENRRVVAVAATAIDRHGERSCVEELVPCPDCRPTETWQCEDP